MHKLIIETLRKLYAFIRKSFFYLSDSLIFLILLPPKQDKTLVIFRLDNIGDFLLWIGTARYLTKQYDGYRTIIIVNKTVSELAKLYTYFDIVIPIDVNKFKSNILYRLSTMQKVRNLTGTVAVQPTHSREFSTGDSLIRISGAKERIGATDDFSRIHPYEQVISNKWYTHLISINQQPLMELARNTAFVQKLIKTDLKPRLARIPQLKLLPISLQFNKPYFIIFPGASVPQRMWPLNHFSECASWINNQYGLDLVICGLESEYNTAEKIIAESSVKNATNLTGKTSLPEFCELIRNASLLVGNETSAVHIAPAVKTSSVCILGGGHFGRFMPYPSSLTNDRSISVYNQMDCFNCNWKCTQKHSGIKPYPCIQQVSVYDVNMAVDKLLSHN